MLLRAYVVSEFNPATGASRPVAVLDTADDARIHAGRRRAALGSLDISRTALYVVNEVEWIPTEKEENEPCQN